MRNYTRVLLLAIQAQSDNLIHVQGRASAYQKHKRYDDALNDAERALGMAMHMS